VEKMESTLKNFENRLNNVIKLKEAILGLDGRNALNLAPPKKSKWVVEIPGFFRKKRLKILAESLMVNPNGALSITIDKDHILCFANGQWCRFYSENALNE
jgi:hypothetical protein